jgi:hypothetical protein
LKSIGQAVSTLGTVKVPDLYLQGLTSLHQQIEEGLTRIAIDIRSPLLGSVNQTLSRFSAALSLVSPSFYRTEDLIVASTPSRIPAKGEAARLADKLRECPRGKVGWRRYEDTCEEILNYCLVPPLKEPSRQETTYDGIQRRDLIYHIPHGSGQFWDYAMTAYFALAIIVECKNHSEPVGQDEVVNTAKYLGERRLGNLGLIMTRRGGNESARMQQVRLWTEDGKMLVLFSDEDLLKMIELKYEGSEPWIVIDRKIRELRMAV